MAKKKDAEPAPTTGGTAEQTTADARLADDYLADLIYGALLERGEAAKASEITLEIDNPRISFPLVRRALGESPRFVSVDRLWNLKARYLDTSRPTERNLEEVLNAAGKPLSRAQLASELSVIYNRPAEIYLSLLAKLSADTSRYFRTVSGEIGPHAWLPLVDAEDEEDILFDNDLTAGQLAPYRAIAKGLAWSDAAYVPSSRAVVSASGGQPVPHRVLGVLARLAQGPAYDPLRHLLACLADPELVWISGGRWIARERADALEAYLAERATDISEEEPIEEAVPVVAAPEPVAVVEEPTDTEAPAAPPPPVPVRNPLEIREADLAAMEQIVVDRGAAVDSVDLLALQFEVVPGDPSFRDDLRTLVDTLKADSRFLHVGAARFREPNSLPLFVFTIPEFLHFPDLQFVSLEGEIMDEEIEDEGFAGTLRTDILDPLAQDAGDDEGRYTGTVPADVDALRLVLKAHHKEIGTFPLCQVPDGFFPTDVGVVEVSIKDPSGQTHDVIVNNDLRLAFNLFGLYEMIPTDSGGVFHLERTPRPYEFRFAPSEENDPAVYLSSARIGELLALREQAEEGGDLATFDIVCEVLAHHSKGLDFVSMLTEVNVVRRVTRRKLASILSNYYCFVQKPGQNLWRFDAKKRDLGTDRAKRKYLKR